MSELDTAKISQINDEDNALLHGVSGYRDGEIFIAKRGFEAPKVCVISGNSNKDELVSLKILLKPHPNEMKMFMVKLCLHILMLGVLLISLFTDRAELNFSFAVISLIVWVSFYYIINRLMSPYIKVYTTRKVRRYYFVKKISNPIVLLTGFWLTIKYPEAESRWWHGLGMILVIVGVTSPLKKLLEVTGLSVDEYKRFEGTHPDFLDTLLFISSLENECDSKEKEA